MSVPLPLHSLIDDSVNWAIPQTVGFTEARYVRRSDDEIIVYLSVQTGCRQACRFCHLTQTGQTDYEDVTVDGLLEQARTVLEHYRTRKPAQVVNFNFMARGEPLASEIMLRYGDEICFRLGQLAAEYQLVPRIKISTIMPATMQDLRLVDVFPSQRPDIYLSLYSMRAEFRRRWLPKAIDPQAALQKLVDWQQVTRKIPVLHWALIEDSLQSNIGQEDIQLIGRAVHQAGLRCDVNLVRYNPAGERTGREPDENLIIDYGRSLQQALPSGCNVRHIDRVGFDVQASCGMFVS